MNHNYLKVKQKSQRAICTILYIYKLHSVYWGKNTSINDITIPN